MTKDEITCIHCQIVIKEEWEHYKHDDLDVCESCHEGCYA